MNNELRRRNAFWRNWEYQLDQLVEEIKARQAEKWCNESDIAGMQFINNKLQEALSGARTHFILALRSLNEEENTNEK